MKVPLIDSPSVASREMYQETSPSMQKPDSSIAESIRSAGIISGGITNRIIAAGERAKKEADAVNISDAQSSLERYANELSFGAKREDGTIEPGFLSLQGKAALEQNAEYNAKLDKRRSDLAAGLTNDAQRRLFEIHSNKTITSVRANFGKHAFQQTSEIKAKSLTALHDAYMDIAASDGDNVDRIENARTAYLEMSRGMLGPTELTKEQDAALVRNTFGDEAAARVSYYLSQDLPEKAKALLEDQQIKDDLGTRLEPISKKVSNAFDIKETKISQQWAADEAKNIVSDISTRDIYGNVDTAKADEKAKSLEFDATDIGLKREALFTKAFAHQMKEAEKEKKLYVSKNVGDGQLSFTQGGWKISAIPPEIAARVQFYDPKTWDFWVNKEASELAKSRREARILASGGRVDHSAQNDENKRAMARLQRELVEMPDEEKKDFNVDAFIAANRLSPTPGVAEQMRLKKSQSIDADGKASDKDRDKFLKDTLKVVNGEIERLGGKTKTNPGDISKMERLRDDAVSMAAEEYDLNKAVKKAPLTPEEKAKVQASIAGSTTVKVGFLKDTTVPAFVSPEYKRKNPDAISPPVPSIVVQSPAPKKQAPGRYKDPKSGRFFIVDTNGARKWEK